MKRDLLDEGYLSIAIKYISSGQTEQGLHFVLQALEFNPTNEQALELLKEYSDKKTYKTALSKSKSASNHVVTTDISNDPTDMSNRRKSDGEVKQSFNSEWKAVVNSEPTNAKVRTTIVLLYYIYYFIVLCLTYLIVYSICIGTLRTGCSTLW